MTVTTVLRDLGVLLLMAAWVVAAHVGSAGWGNADFNAAVAVLPIAAALLMANLQASLRSRGPYAWNDLPGVIQSVNQLFCESTERERYATLSTK